MAVSAGFECHDKVGKSEWGFVAHETLTADIERAVHRKKGHLAAKAVADARSPLVSAGGASVVAGAVAVVEKADLEVVRNGLEYRSQLERSDMAAMYSGPAADEDLYHSHGLSCLGIHGP